jgi:glycosyltransferase involved in cell wall biosynthesis
MKHRRILLDGYWLADGPPSGRNVVQSVVRQWPESFPEDHVVVALPRALPAHEFDQRAQEIVKATVKNHAAWLELNFSSLGSQRWDAVLTQNFAPGNKFGRARRATFFHDAMYADHPDWFSRAERVYLGVAGRLLRRADVVLTSSEAEARRIDRIYPTVAGRIRPVGLGLPVSLRSADPTPVPAAEVGPFVLSVGRLNVRKNLGRLINAFLQVEEMSDWRLLIVGSADGRTGDTDHSSDRVQFLGSVTDSELTYLYQTCSVFAFPSLDEGFGLPLLEAEYFGAPIVASKTPAFEELNNADRYFNPVDESSIRAALQASAVSTGVRVPDSKPYRVHGTASRFDWDPVVKRIRNAMFPEEDY